MKENNLEFLKARASYQDLFGTAALSWDINEHTALIEVAKKAGIDSEKYEPISLRIFLSKGSFVLSLYIADIRSKETKRSLRLVATELTLVEFQALLNNFVIVISPPHRDLESEFEYEGEVEYEDL